MTGRPVGKAKPLVSRICAFQSLSHSMKGCERAEKHDEGKRRQVKDSLRGVEGLALQVMD